MTAVIPPGACLNVGSGPLLADGWVSLDGSWQAWLAARPLMARAASLIAHREVGHWPRGIVCRDVRTGLGMGDNSAAVVYSSHFIEHLTREEAARFLRECWRVLAPGGVCRIVTPDLNALVNRYVSASNGSARVAADRFLEATLLTPHGDVPSTPWLRWYRARKQFDTHKWLYDATSLEAAMATAGFSAPRGCRYLESAIPSAQLQRVEYAERIANGEGIAVEARK